MTTEEKEILDSETQDNDGDDVTTDEVEDTSSENEPANEELTKAQQIAEDQKRRAEKAELKLKELKAQLEDNKPEPKETEGQEETKSSNTPSKEEVILYARGLSEEEVEKVKSIAKIEGESPLVAAESDYFKIWKQKQDEQKETQETQLGTSKGSVKRKPQKDFGSNGLTPDEHKALWREKMGR